MPRLNFTQDQLEEKARDVRRSIIAALAAHPGTAPAGALAGADLLTTLFFYEINFKLDELEWAERDIWHVSSRTLAPALHAVMAEVGFFPARDLLALGETGHHLGAVPSARTAGIEVSAGAPGAGLSIAVGVALASRLDGNPRRVYAVLDDAEVQAGSMWEAAMAAAHFELDNLVLAIDLDGWQADGEIEEVVAVAPLAEKLRAFNWHVIEVDGNDVSELVDAFDRSRSLRGAPTAILSCTIPGHGVSRLAEAGVALTAEAANEALHELGTTLEDWRRRLAATDGKSGQSSRR